MTYIALLRAINIGAHNRIAMADLRAMCDRIDLPNAKTLLVSGNLVFESGIPSSEKLERLLEAASTKHLDVTTDYFVRSAQEWQAIIDANPFPAEAKKDPARLILMCLRAAPSAGAVRALQSAINGRETVGANGKQAYFIYPDGMGNSKLTIAMIEKAFGTRGTARNWNTVLKLGGLTK
jgi:uncharacterized protein (DUF1697 family)